MLKFIILGLIGSVICQEVTLDDWANGFPLAGTQELKREIVPIKTSHLQKRDLQGGKHIQFKAFGNNIKLWLNPIDDILVGEKTPVYEVHKQSSVSDNFHFIRYKNAIKAVTKNLYENAQHAATVIINEIPDDEVSTVNSNNNTSDDFVNFPLNNPITLTGYLGNGGLFIRPIPNNFMNHIRRMRRSVDGIPDSESEHYQYHMVYQMAGTPETLKFHAEPLKVTTKSKRSAYNILYPEIFLIVDHPLYKLFKENMVDTLSYLVPFWNAVDMKFRNFENPKVRLNIATIVIAKQPDVLPYMYNNKLKNNDVLEGLALTNVTRTFMSKITKLFPSNSYDFTVTMTSDHFCHYEGKSCVHGTLGISMLGGACTYDVNNALVHDNAGYTGIHTAAHEIGHLLGADHDNIPNTMCAYELGHMMAGSLVLNRDQSSDWSPCSLKYIEKFLTKEHAVCLANKPNAGKQIPRYLPGLIMSADEQCQKLQGPRSYAMNIDICIQLVCYHPMSIDDPVKYGTSETIAADGTICGEDKICLNSRCIDRKEAGL